MRGQGYPESSIKTTGRRLRNLAKYCCLDDPVSVKGVIAAKAVSSGYKDNLVKAYGYYVQCRGLVWTKPRYRRESRLPRVPTAEAISKIIARASWRYATIFCVLRDTGMMPEELHRTSLRDVDLEKGLINAPGCKGHKARVLRLKSQTVAMLKRYLKNCHNATNPFPKSRRMSEAWRRYRNDLAEKLSDPQLKTIRLYDLRHYFGTATYHRTRDILLVKELMGHSKIETTLIYTQLVDFAEDEYMVKSAKTVAQATALLESGFEYVTVAEGLMLFRKPK